MWTHTGKAVCPRLAYLKNRIQKNKLPFAFALVLVLSITVLLNSDFSPDLYFLYTLEDVKCHYLTEGDALPSVSEDYEPPASSIFFHETSCSGRLNSRQACAVESAARAHPQWQVHLFFAGAVTEEDLNTDALAIVRKIANVKVMRVHIVDYAKGTPLEVMVRGGALNRTRWRISHTSDVLRYLSLYKWGGVYLDLDMVVMKDFGELAENWAARESEDTVAAGALAFSRGPLGRIVANAAIRDLKENYRGDVWPINGPWVITRTLIKLCGTDDISAMSAELCKGFEVYGPELFYPVSYNNAEAYFSPGELDVGVPYTHHVWNKLTADEEVKEDYVYAKLAKKYCPEVYQFYGKRFGL